jgi:hypothetical protein
MVEDVKKYIIFMRYYIVLMDFSTLDIYCIYFLFKTNQLSAEQTIELPKCLKVEFEISVFDHILLYLDRIKNTFRSSSSILISEIFNKCPNTRDFRKCAYNNRFQEPEHPQLGVNISIYPYFSHIQTTSCCFLASDID